jgi:hypothetical protein
MDEESHNYTGQLTDIWKLGQNFGYLTTLQTSETVI